METLGGFPNLPAKLRDAIQLATAVHEGCFALLGHDRDFGNTNDLLILD
jgi:predicted nucleic acid-binding protein